MGASCSWCSTIVKTNVAALLLLPLRLLQPVRASVLRRGEGGGQREARLRVGKNYKTECRSRGTQGSGAHGMWTHGGRGVGAGRRPMGIQWAWSLRSLTQHFGACNQPRPAIRVARSRCARLLQLLPCAAWQVRSWLQGTKLEAFVCSGKIPVQTATRINVAPWTGIVACVHLRCAECTQLQPCTCKLTTLRTRARPCVSMQPFVGSDCRDFPVEHLNLLSL